MTNLSQNDSSLPPDQAETATVTLLKIVDSNQLEVLEGQTTYDKTLTADGTAASNIALRLRDGVSPLDDNVQSNGSGRWFSTVTLPEFKRYRFSIIEKNPPQDFSKITSFVLATATPLIKTVIGKDGPIENGAIYDGDSLKFTGNAPPSVEVEAFNDGISLAKKATVNRDGLFEFTLDELTEETYHITFKAPDGKESAVFTFTVAVESPTTIEDVVDDNENSVGEGESTLEKNLTIIGKAKALATITLVGGVPTPVEATTNDKGDWSHRFENLTNADYSITAESIGNPLAPTGPRTFTVRAAEAVKLLNITDPEGTVIDEGSITTQKSLYVNCTGEKGKKIQAVDVDGETPLGEEIVKENGDCNIAIGPLSDKLYEIKAVGLYPEGGESRTYSFTVETAEQSEITHVIGKDGEEIENGNTTTSRWFVIRGKAGANEQMKLNGSHVTPEPTDTANDQGICVLFISQVPLGTHTYTIQKSDSSTPASKPWEVKVSAP